MADQIRQRGIEKPSVAHIGIGTRVGMLTVAASTEERRDRYIIWLCRCDCGGEIRLDTRCLQRGTVTDCGCTSRVKPGRKDISGQRFGMLIAVEPTGETRGGSAVWRCRCDCGGEVCAPLHQLRAGYRRSCGCLSHPARKDYIGKRFGRLTVTAYAGKRDGMHRWKCLCDCGNETVAGQTLIQTGKTRSCGCLQSETYRDNLKLIDGTSVTILESVKNRRGARNASGRTGVYLNRKTGRWDARITFKGKTYYLGSYAERQDAIRARERGEEMHDDFLEWYYESHPRIRKTDAAVTAHRAKQETPQNDEAGLT